MNLSKSGIGGALDARICGLPLTQRGGNTFWWACPEPAYRTGRSSEGA
jgi:hypothetical protein